MSNQVPVIEAKGKVKFGLNQIRNKTPEIATWIFRVILYAAAIINIVLDVFTEIPSELKGQIAVYSIKIVGAVHALSKMFGLEVKAPATLNKTNELEAFENKHDVEIPIENVIEVAKDEKDI